MVRALGKLQLAECSHFNTERPLTLSYPSRNLPGLSSAKSTLQNKFPKSFPKDSPTPCNLSDRLYSSYITASLLGSRPTRDGDLKDRIMLTKQEAFEIGADHGNEMANESGSNDAGCDGWDGMLINADPQFARENFGWDGCDSSDKAKALLAEYCRGCQSGADAAVATTKVYRVASHNRNSLPDGRELCFSGSPLDCDRFFNDMTQMDRVNDQYLFGQDADSAVGYENWEHAGVSC